MCSIISGNLCPTYWYYKTQLSKLNRNAKIKQYATILITAVNTLLKSTDFIDELANRLTDSKFPEAVYTVYCLMA